jgi:hypothetical protein
VRSKPPNTRRFERALAATLALFCLLFTGLEVLAQPSSRPAPTSDPTHESARKVRVGLYLADLVEIDGSKQSFLADVMMSASWTDPTLIGTSEKARTVDANEVWHPELLIVNQRSVERSLPERVTVHPDGSCRYLQRFTGVFSAALDLRSFPRDRQRLHVWVIAPLLMGDPVELLVDDSLSTLRSKELSIGDWRVAKIEMSPRAFHATAQERPAPGIELSVAVERRVTYYVIQVLVPLFAILLMAWTVYWIPPKTINVRISVNVTTMLTLIAYRFALANHVPRLSYLTRLDWFLLGATALVMLTLGAMAYSAYLVRTGREEKVEVIDRYGRILYPCLVIAFTIAMWLPS